MANNLWSATTTDVGQNGDIALECTKTYNGDNIISGQNIGFADGQDASTIVELYVSGPTGGGLHAYVNGSSEEFLTDSKITFDYVDMERSNMLSTYLSGGRIVYSLHNVNSESLALRIGTAGGNDSGTTFKYSATYGAQTDSWLSHEDWEGNMYYTFTGYNNNIWEYTTLPVTKNKKYTFYLHTYSQAGYDGIIISSQQITSPKSPNSVTVGSGGVLATCSGVDITYTTSVYRPSSNGNVYIYYRTNTSTLAGSGTKEVVDFDTHGTPSYSYESNPYTTGDIKVIVETVPQSTITLNDNGGSGGDGTIEVDTGSTLSSLQVELPSRRNSSSYPYYEFLGYYTSVSYTGGTQRIGSTGNLSGSVTINSNVSWYARWSNTISYSPSTSQTIDYSTSSQNVSLTSTAGKCSSGGTVTYTITSILKDGSTQSITGWSISSDGKTLTVPASQGAGSYVVYVKATSPNSTSTSNTFAGATLNKTINLTISGPSTITITLNANGGSGGSTSVTVSPGASSWSVPTIPTRTGFTFMGYYTSATSGTQYTNASGSSVRAAPSSNTTLYANWLNKITLGGSSYTSNIEVYCSDSSIDPLTELNKTVGTRNIPWTQSAPSCPAGSIDAYEIGQGWSMSSGGQYIVLEPDWDAGTYELEIELESPSGTNYRGDVYSANIEFTILPVTRYPNNTNPTKYKNTSGTTGTTISYGTPTCSIGTNPGLTAAGGSATVSCSATNTTYWYWKYTNNTWSSQQSSTASGTVTWSITTQTFTPTGSSTASNITRFSKSSNTLSHTTMDTNAGTDYVKITATNSGDSSKTKTAEKSITNGYTDGSPVIVSYGVPICSIGTGLSAAGGSATVTTSVSNTQRVIRTYDSGSTENTDTSVSGSVTWSITTQTFTPTGSSTASNITRFSKSGSKLNHTTMGTNAGTDYVKITATNSGDPTQTKTATKSITNTLSWSDPVITHSTPVSLSVQGQTYSMSPTVSQSGSYTSGSTATNTSGTYGYTVKTSKDGYSLSTNQVTVTNNSSTSARNGFVVTIAVSGCGGDLTATKDVAFSQVAGSKVYTLVSVCNFKYQTNIAASGATVTPSFKSYKIYYKWNNTGTSSYETSGGTITYSAPTHLSYVTLASDFGTTGRITISSRGTETGNPRNFYSGIYEIVTKGNLSGSKQATAGQQVANAVTSVTLAVNPSEIEYGETANADVTVYYTSTASTVVTTNVTFSTDPSDIVTIS